MTVAFDPFSRGQSRRAAHAVETSRFPQMVSMDIYRSGGHYARLCRKPSLTPDSAPRS